MAVARVAAAVVVAVAAPAAGRKSRAVASRAVPRGRLRKAAGRPAVAVMHRALRVVAVAVASMPAVHAPQAVSRAATIVVAVAAAAAAAATVAA